jgi:hypothetical protein
MLWSIFTRLQSTVVSVRYLAKPELWLDPSGAATATTGKHKRNSLFPKIL